MRDADTDAVHITGVHTYAHPDGYDYSQRDPNGNGHSYCDGYTYRHSYCHRYSYRNRYSHCATHSNTYPDSDPLAKSTSAGPQSFDEDAGPDWR